MIIGENEMFKDLSIFLRQFRENFHATGAIAPSSSYLAHAIVKPMKKRPERPIKVLEVGPGTGAFTMRILKKLKNGDVLHIFELNRKFYEHLRKKINMENIFAQGIQFQLFNADIRTLKNNQEYDYIISGLPFANFEVEVFCEIMENFLKHLAPDGVISYFEYILPHRFRTYLLEKNEKKRLQHLIDEMHKYIKKYQVACDHVWLNFPPARARHLKKPAIHSQNKIAKVLS
jgi:phosphatidylethanolamine/phosphatidyl-N-methylethanolamine N-methyltransferase